MDAFQRIAHSFKKDCQKKLETLEMASTIMDSSATVAEALRLIFVHSEIYPGDYEQMSSMAHEIDRLRNCIESTDVSRPSRFQSVRHPLSERMLLSGDRRTRPKAVRHQLQFDR